jgi:hypothetical protein
MLSRLNDDVSPMPASSDETPDPKVRLEAAMEEVMVAMEADEPYDRQALLGKYADVAADLSECLRTALYRARSESLYS